MHFLHFPQGNTVHPAIFSCSPLWLNTFSIFTIFWLSSLVNACFQLLIFSHCVTWCRFSPSISCLELRNAFRWWSSKETSLALKSRFFLKKWHFESLVHQKGGGSYTYLGLDPKRTCFSNASLIHAVWNGRCFTII